MANYTRWGLKERVYQVYSHPMPVLSPAYLYQASVAAFTVLLLGNSLLNAWSFRKPRAFVATGGDQILPLISILVPARNEERSIAACVESLLAMNYPNFEVLVLDDHSTDETYPILCRLRDRDPRLRVLVGAELLEGWYGKPNACWQLAQAARGEYLLMTDADCEFAPDTLLLALGAITANHADVISLSPDLVCESFWERLIIPLQYMIIFAFLPSYMIRHSRHHWFAAAHGAFFFLRRETYFDLDGHRAVRQELAEDIKFAQHVKKSGKTLWYGDGSRAYSVRMYHNLAEIWSGFSKNAFPAFDKNLPLFTSTLMMLALVFVLPPIFAFWGWAHGRDWAWLPLFVYLSMVGMRLCLSARFRQDGILEALLHPFAWAAVIGIGINSARLALSKHGATWKGRAYVKP
jgi:chlorobactene glucosyltransferase